MNDVKAALYVGALLGCFFTAIPAFYLFDANARKIGALEAKDSINTERLRDLESFLAGYKDAHQTRR